MFLKHEQIQQSLRKRFYEHLDRTSVNLHTRTHNLKVLAPVILYFYSLSRNYDKCRLHIRAILLYCLQNGAYATVTIILMFYYMALISLSP